MWSVKFVYSEKATKFREISTLLLSTIHTDKSKVEISQNFVAFSEYMNFIYNFAVIVILVPYLRLLIAVPWSSDPLTPYVALDEGACSLFIPL